MRRVRRALGARAVQSVLILILMLTSASGAAAQTDGGIIGQVKDESGAVLPGVTVTATGPALQVAVCRRRDRRHR